MTKVYKNEKITDSGLRKVILGLRVVTLGLTMVISGQEFGPWLTKGSKGLISGVRKLILGIKRPRGTDITYVQAWKF